jgi:hypothetical protein
MPDFLSYHLVVSLSVRQKNFVLGMAFR